MPIRSFDISQELDSFISSSIESGEYSSADAVIQSALTLLQQEEEDDDYKMYELRKAIDEGFASGIAEGSTDEVFARVRERAGLPVRARA
jgi:putative addiction module CopG family antidote